MDKNGTMTRVEPAAVAKYGIETYNGSTIAGSAQTVKSALDTLNSKFTTTIKTGDNLNDYTTSGLYIINAAAGNVENCPAGYSALIVTKVPNVSTVHQLCYNNNFIYTRAYTGNPLAWSAWKSVTLS